MNAFIESLGAGPAKLGLWQALANPLTAEICAGAGFDWLLFDGEHAPNTLQTLLAQLQAVSAYPLEPIARVPVGEAWVIKQYLDIGFRTLLIPMVDSPEQASAVVAAARFPLAGVRGASTASRATSFGRDRDFFARAAERTSIIVQIESVAALAQIEAIAAVDGVDALFVGPSDLAASLGHVGNPRAPKVQAAIKQAIETVLGTGKPVGYFGLDPDDARERIAQGVSFVSIGSDIGILSGGATALRARVAG